MSISERQAQILVWVVKSYVALATPISSEYLKKRYRLILSSATIRSELQALTDDGYLEQPHISGGRVPTDKGYRFYVNTLKRAKKMDSLDEKMAKEIGVARKEEDHLLVLKEASRILSSLSSSLIVSSFLERKMFIKEGWSETFDDPEFSDIKMAKNFLSMIDCFEEDIYNFDLDFSTQTYIGEEVPFSKSDDFSMIVAKCLFFGKEEGIIAIMGPKRMPYDRNIFLMDSVIKLLKENNI